MTEPDWQGSCPPRVSFASRVTGEQSTQPSFPLHHILYPAWPWTVPSSLAFLASPRSVSPLPLLSSSGLPVSFLCPEVITSLDNPHFHMVISLSYVHMLAMCSFRLSTSECTCSHLSSEGAEMRDMVPPHIDKIRKHTGASLEELESRSRKGAPNLQ